MEPHGEAQLEFLPLFTDELWFLVAPDHPWAAKGQVEREEIPRQNYILYNRSSYTSRLVEEYFREAAMMLNLCIESGSMETIREQAMVSLGAAITSPGV